MLTGRYTQTDACERLTLYLPATPACIWYRLYVAVVGGNRRTGYVLRQRNRRNALLLVCQHGLTRSQVEGQIMAVTVVWHPTVVRQTTTCTITVEQVLDGLAGTSPDTLAALPSVLDLLAQSAMPFWIGWAGCAHRRVRRDGRL